MSNYKLYLTETSGDTESGFKVEGQGEFLENVTSNDFDHLQLFCQAYFGKSTNRFKINWTNDDAVISSINTGEPVLILEPDFESREF